MESSMHCCHNLLALEANFNHFIEPPQFRFTRLIEQCQLKATKSPPKNNNDNNNNQLAAIDCQTARQKSYVNWLIKRDDDDNLLCRLRVFFSCFIFVSFSFVARVFSICTLNALFLPQMHRYFCMYNEYPFLFYFIFFFLSPKVQQQNVVMNFCKLFFE